VLGLIALFSSYDHITRAGRRFHLQHQRGITFIATAVAIIVFDAQLVSRSRLRAPAAQSPPNRAPELPEPRESTLPSPIPWPGLDPLGFIQALRGLVLGLIALFSSYDHIPSPVAPSNSNSNWESLSSLPRWRQFISDLCNTVRHLGATLN
jgi:hypothetical protein